MTLPFPGIPESTWLAVRSGLSGRFPAWTAAVLARTSLALSYGGRTPAEAMALVPSRLADRDAWEEDIFRLNVSATRDACGGKLPRILSIQFPYAYDGQLSSVVDALRLRPGLPSLNLAMGSYLDQRTDRRLSDLARNCGLVVPREELLSTFEEADLVFLTEGISCPWIGSRPRRVGLPHTPQVGS